MIEAETVSDTNLQLLRDGICKNYNVPEQELWQSGGALVIPSYVFEAVQHENWFHELVMEFSEGLKQNGKQINLI